MAHQDSSETKDYRLSPLLAVKVIGLAVLAAALVVFGSTIALAVADLGAGYLVIPILAVLLFIAGIALWATRRGYAVRFTAEGYHVRGIRGAGVEGARWKQVEDVGTTYVADSPCLVIRLRDGGTTTIPVDALAIDKDQLVRDLQGYLERGQGLKPL